MANDELESLTKAVLAGAPVGTVIVGLSVAPDGHRAAALTFLPSAEYPMDDLFDYETGAWHAGEGGSGGPGIQWTGGSLGILRFSGEALEGATTAVIAYEGGEHRAPVNHGHFLLSPGTRHCPTIPN